MLQPDVEQISKFNRGKRVCGLSTGLARYFVFFLLFLCRKPVRRAAPGMGASGVWRSHASQARAQRLAPLAASFI